MLHKCLILISFKTTKNLNVYKIFYYYLKNIFKQMFVKYINFYYKLIKIRKTLMLLWLWVSSIFLINI